MPEYDDRAIRRSAKLTALLRSFEYINEVVSSNHGMKPEEMVKIVNESFRRSIQASVQYHSVFAQEEEKQGDTIKANYHKAMIDVYMSLLK